MPDCRIYREPHLQTRRTGTSETTGLSKGREIVVCFVFLFCFCTWKDGAAGKRLTAFHRALGGFWVQWCKSMKSGLTRVKGQSWFQNCRYPEVVCRWTSLTKVLIPESSVVPLFRGWSMLGLADLAWVRWHGVAQQPLCLPEQEVFQYNSFTTFGWRDCGFWFWNRLDVGASWEMAPCVTD